MHENCFLHVEIKELLNLLSGSCDLNAKVILKATLDILFDFYSHIAKHKSFPLRNAMRTFIGSILQLFRKRKKSQLVKNVIFKYYVGTDIIVSLLSQHKHQSSSRVWAVRSLFTNARCSFLCVLVCIRNPVQSLQKSDKRLSLTLVGLGSVFSHTK